MSWTFERVFYGSKQGLDLKSIWDFLGKGYYFIPRTLFTGYYRAVHRVGDYNDLYRTIEKPFPDAILAQKPNERFALHLSGGFDSSILAKLYDREDADYIHLTGPESHKARSLAATLKGTLHEIQITPERFIREADELCPRLVEPYAFEDIVYVYIASKKAKELGHTLVLTGDGGDWIFGGYMVGPNSQLAADVWKTLEPHRILGLETSAPLAHRALELWSKEFVPEENRSSSKLFARRYCEDLGMPDEITAQRKMPWSGTLGINDNEAVLQHVQEVVDQSDYRWINDFDFPTPPRPQLWFRQYSLVKWLQVNYKERLKPQEVKQFTQQVAQINAAEKKQSRDARLKAFVYRYCPHCVIRTARRVRNRVLRG